MLIMSDQHLISPYSKTTVLFIKIMRIKEMVANLRSFDCLTNSPCRYQRKCKRAVWRIYILGEGVKDYPNKINISIWATAHLPLP